MCTVCRHCSGAPPIIGGISILYSLESATTVVSSRRSTPVCSYRSRLLELKLEVVFHGWSGSFMVVSSGGHIKLAMRQPFAATDSSRLPEIELEVVLRRRIAPLAAGSGGGGHDPSAAVGHVSRARRLRFACIYAGHGIALCRRGVTEAAFSRRADRLHRQWHALVRGVPGDAFRQARES